eukprot:9170617-Pyramimonas_sp.AAC.1
MPRQELQGAFGRPRRGKAAGPDALANDLHLRIRHPAQMKTSLVGRGPCCMKQGEVEFSQKGKGDQGKLLPNEASSEGARSQ